MRLWGLALVMLLGVAASYAQAQSANECIDSCFSNFSPLQNNGSTELRDECLQTCNARARSTVLYGAIAFGPRTGSWGVAYSMPSAARAQEAALARCREHGDDCQLATSYSNVCAAVATVRAKARFVTAQADNAPDAKSRALAVCQAQIGGGCQVWVYSCASDTQ